MGMIERQDGHLALLNERGGIGMIVTKDKNGNKTGGFLKPCVVRRTYPSPDEVKRILTGSIFGHDPSGIIEESFAIQDQKRKNRVIPANMKIGI